MLSPELLPLEGERTLAILGADTPITTRLGEPDVALSRGEDLAGRVKAAVDIVDVAKTYFPVTARGERYWALCPFHREKTPSFSIHPGLQIFNCFGCNKWGDVLTLVMDIEHVTFPEALRMLADRAGIALPRREASSPEEERRRRLFDLVAEAAKFYAQVLASPAGQVPREYLLKRGFTPQSIAKFGLGYAPNDWRVLLPHLKRKGFADAEVIAAGLAKAKDGSAPWDFLRGRVLIPIRDPRGRVIAFGGRVLDDSEPKYLNTSDTDLFSKRTVLFGMERARIAAASKGYFVVVEGYMDALAAHQHGFEHVVATLGTALTKEHARLMRPHAARALLLFDADDGGRRAADRGAPLLLQEDLDVRVAALPDGKDPDEYLQEHGVEAFEAFLDKAGEDLLTFLIRRAREEHGTGVGATARAARDVLSHVGSIDDPIRFDLYLKRVAQAFGIEERLLRAEVVGAKRTGRADSDATSATFAVPNPPRKYELTGADQDELAVLLGMMTDASLAQSAKAALCVADFRDDARRRVFAAASSVLEDGIVPSPSTLQERLSQDHDALEACALALSRELAPGESVTGSLARVVGRRDEVEYQKVRAELNAARNETGAENADEEQENRLLAELQRFHARRRARSKSVDASSAEFEQDPSVKNEESGG